VSDILSQAEIEALLSTLNADANANGGGGVGGSKPAKGKGAPSHGSKAVQRAMNINYEPYDFRRPDKLSKDQLRTLSMLHDTFARAASDQSWSECSVLSNKRGSKWLLFRPILMESKLVRSS